MFFLCFQAVFKHSCCRVRGHSLAANGRRSSCAESLASFHVWCSSVLAAGCCCCAAAVPSCSALMSRPAASRPGRQVTLIGSDGLQYIFLAKPKDDLRKVGLLPRLASALHPLIDQW